MRSFNLGPFTGPITALDPRMISETSASDELNVRHEDGKLKPRYGYRNLDGIPSNFTSIHGLDYIQGYNSSNVLVEEFITAERLSTMTAGKCKLYSRHVTTGAETEITNGGTPVELTNTSNWRSFAWRDVAYICNPYETSTSAVYRHTIGTANSLLALTAPADPTTTPMAYRIDYQTNGSLQYAVMNWAGTDAADVTVTGCARKPAVLVDPTNNLLIRHENAVTAGVDGSFEVDLNAITAGIQDWYGNDIFAFTMTVRNPTILQIDPTSIVVTFTNNAGTPVLLIATKIDVITLTTQANPIYTVRVQFDNKTRTDWGNGAGSGKVKKVKVAYRITTSSGTQSNNEVVISQITVGCCPIAPPQITYREPGYYQVVPFGYSYYSSGIGGGMESGVSAVCSIPRAALLGSSPYPNIDPLGCWVTLTTAASADGNVDNVRIYWKDDELKWRRIATQSDATTTYTIKLSYGELLALTQYTPNAFTQTGVITGFAFRGWAVWLYQGGYQNVRHSRIGLPESHYSLQDSPNDPNRGATFSMANNFGDEPFGGADCDGACMLVGNTGIYAQVAPSGNLPSPSEMTPPKRLPGSFGAPNAYAFTKMPIDGKDALVSIAKDGEGIYAYIVNSNFDGDTGFQVIELSKNVRPSLVDFMATPQSLTNFSTARITYEPNTDSLWVIMGVRAMVLRRASLVTNSREWEFYRFGIDSSETVSFIAASTRTRLKWFRSHGKFDEVEWNATTLAYIAGASRDGGNALPSPYWTSKVFVGARRRIMWIDVDRQTLTDTPTVQVISTEATNSYTIITGKRFLKIKASQLGTEHQFKITLAEASGYISRFEVTESSDIGAKRRIA